MIETNLYWGVMIRRRNHTAFLASGKDAPIALFNARSTALNYAKDLRRECKLPTRRCVAVKVKATYEVI